MSKSNGFPPAEYETFTPDELRTILKKQRNPRKISDGHVNRLKASVTRGNFETLNGQTLVFDDQGRLVNGQHRAAAYALAETPLTILTVRGVTSGLAEIDSGRRRMLADVLGGLGWNHAKTVGAAALILHSIWDGIDPFTGYSTSTRPITTELMTTVGKIKRRTMDWAAAMPYRCKPKLYPPSTYCAVLYQAALSNRTKAEKFDELARSGANLAESHPIFGMRRYFLAANKGHGKEARRSAYGILVKAWNLYQAGAKQSGIYYMRANEELPTVE